MYMYEEPKQYEDAWVEADRELAILNYELGLIGLQQSGGQSVEVEENALVPEPVIGKDADSFSREDFIRSLKRVSRSIGKGKS